jgi:hypothetical protein
MVAATMDKLQWEYILAPILKATLPRMGYNRTFPRDVVYTLEALCGLGVLHPVAQPTSLTNEGPAIGDFTAYDYRRSYSGLAGTISHGDRVTWPF